jgi:hypothetical protein
MKKRGESPMDNSKNKNANGNGKPSHWMLPRTHHVCKRSKHKRPRTCHLAPLSHNLNVSLTKSGNA